MECDLAHCSTKCRQVIADCKGVVINHRLNEQVPGCVPDKLGSGWLGSARFGLGRLGSVRIGSDRFRSAEGRSEASVG